MNHDSLACDRSQLEKYLQNSLDVADQSQLLRHLDDCQACRRNLDAIAANDNEWSDAEAFLKDTDSDVVALSGTSPRSQDEADVMQSAQIAAVLAVLDPTDHPQMLGRLAGYEVSGVIGNGGMGVVLKAHDQSLDRMVAMKVMAPHLASSPSARRRFAREARAAAAVLHPNVIAIHGVSNEAKLPFLVMPYIGGESLQRRIDRLGPLPVEQILRISQQIAAGLAAAHAQGLVHRDIKPANILLEQGVDRVFITDFGLARAVDDASLTCSGMIAGTPMYMSPEQARGESLDGRSDLFSLGSVIHAMCTGHPPFQAETSYGVIRQITESETPDIKQKNPNIPSWLCRLVTHLHQQQPSRRIESAEKCETLLRQCIAHLEQPSNHHVPKFLTKPIFLFKRGWFKYAVFAIAAILFLSLAAKALTTIENQTEDVDVIEIDSSNRPNRYDSVEETEIGILPTE